MSINRDPSYTVTGFVVWGICAFFFLYEFLLRTVIGTFQHPIMYDLKLSSFKFSLISTSTYLLIYGLMQIPAGLIVDRFGLKKSLFIGSAVSSLSAIGFGYTHHFYSALFFRVFTGLGSSVGFICLLVAVYDWMPKRNIAFLIGLSQFIGTLGPMIAAGPINAIAQGSTLTWRNIFFILGLIGIFLTFMILLFVKNSSKKQGVYLILRRKERVRANIKQLFSRFQPWGIALFSASVYFAIEFLSENDGKIFVQLKGYSSNFSSYMLTLAWLGYAIGCPLLGFLSDSFQRRKKIMLSASIIAVVVIVTIVFSKEKHALIAAFFLLGIAASGQSVGFAAIAEQFKAGYLALGLGLNNAMITVIASINAPIVGFLIDSIKVTTHTTLRDYEIAFYSLIISSCSGLILVIFLLKETFCKSAVDFTYLNTQSRGN